MRIENFGTSFRFYLSDDYEELINNSEMIIGLAKLGLWLFKSPNSCCITDIEQTADDECTVTVVEESKDTYKIFVRGERFFNEDGVDAVDTYKSIAKDTGYISWLDRLKTFEENIYTDNNYTVVLTGEGDIGAGEAYLEKAIDSGQNVMRYLVSKVVEDIENCRLGNYIASFGYGVNGDIYVRTTGPEYSLNLSAIKDSNILTAPTIGNGLYYEVSSDRFMSAKAKEAIQGDCVDRYGFVYDENKKIIGYVFKVEDFDWTSVTGKTGQMLVEEDLTGEQTDVLQKVYDLALSRI